MAKQVIVDQDAVEEALRVTKEFGFGLILGQVHSGEKDAVFRFVPTPAAPKPKGKGKIQSIQFDTNWSVEHAVQVRRISPGGVKVIGMYAVTASKTFPTNLDAISGSLRQVCVDTYESTRKAGPEAPANPGHHLLLNICPYSKVITGRLFEEVEPKGRPVDIKLQPVISKLCLFESSVEIDYLVPLSIDSSKTVFQQMMHGLLPLFHGIRASTAASGGRLVVADEEIVSSSVEKKTKGRKDDTISDQPARYVELLSSTEGILDGEQLNLSKAEWTMRVQGSIRGYALAQGRETYGSAIEYLKDDFVKSICTRLELVAQGAEDENGQNPFMTRISDDPTILRSFLDVGSDPLPKRVLFRQPGSIIFLDYAVESEKKQDIYSRMQELTGIQTPLDEVEIEDIEETHEGGKVFLQPLQSHTDHDDHAENEETDPSNNPPDGNTLISGGQESVTTQTLSPSKQANSNQGLILMISVAILVMAVAFAMTRS